MRAGAGVTNFNFVRPLWGRGGRPRPRLPLLEAGALTGASWAEPAPCEGSGAASARP